MDFLWFWSKLYGNVTVERGFSQRRSFFDEFLKKELAAHGIGFLKKS
ncbi:hypothetical protein Aconfl_01840 [Algoriphagus confluentis]|uniref:Uncharacterized protein n=1 Tax=Algoriphagus confluentis TaxID=1697556 RepID=A0ABQ6PI20_9BACT|nr:hypothetical protein Aconfl_01840 [Algoriphagus confluentis]